MHLHPHLFVLATSLLSWRLLLPGRAPLFKLMEDDFKAKMQAEEEAKRAAYEAEVAAAKLATVSQLVKGEVVIKPPAGSISPGRRSPGELTGQCVLCYAPSVC
jgi:hypothetical protein